jgi:para-aminobenzoate synthetase component I
MTLTFNSLPAAIREPFVVELLPAPTVVDALRAVGHWSAPLLLDSALQREGVGRYSFLMADPIERWSIQEPRFGQDPFQELEQCAQRFRIPRIPELPPFQGGIAGMMGYELGRCWERVRAARHDEFQLPVFTAGLYDWVIAWDHALKQCWLVSHGLAEADPKQRSRQAELRGRRVLACLENGRRKSPGPRILSAGKSLETGELAPLWAAPGLPGLLSNFSRDGYLETVRRVLEFIYAGDIFQANLSQRLLYPLYDLDPLELFDRLRTVNPAPFAGLMVGDDWAVISASPERFLRVDEDEVETRPIKGTRRRPHGAEADLFTQDELRTSEKDIAENVMIVDLLRNDLSRVCRAGTVRVPQLCDVETYRTVQHLVSEVRGLLRPGQTAWDLFRATFPGGSISGAPKVRAMEIIAELEPNVRGPYTGSLFYVGFDGTVDSNLLIRTLVWKGGWLQCGVGGGIVAQSNPVAEYEETLHKAAGMLQALK